jgi:hypothetical protein
VILYFLPLHQQAAAGVRLLVRLMLAALVAVVHTPVALVRLATHPLHRQAKATAAVMAVPQVVAEVAVLAQRAVTHLALQAALAVTVLRQAFQAHR